VFSWGCRRQESSRSLPWLSHLLLPHPSRWARGCLGTCSHGPSFPPNPLARLFSLTQGPAGHPLNRVSRSAILDRLSGCSAPPEPTHRLLCISPLAWDGEGPGCSHSGLVGLRTAQPSATAAHRQLQGRRGGPGVCPGSVTASGPSLSPVAEQQREGVLAVPKGPISGCPSPRAGPVARGANPGEGQGGVSRAQPAEQRASPTLPGAQAPAITGPQPRLGPAAPSSLAPAAETPGEPGRALPRDQPRLERQGRARAGANGRKCERAKVTLRTGTGCGPRRGCPPGEVRLPLLVPLSLPSHAVEAGMRAVGRGARTLLCCGTARASPIPRPRRGRQGMGSLRARLCQKQSLASRGCARARRGWAPGAAPWLLLGSVTVASWWHRAPLLSARAGTASPGGSRAPRAAGDGVGGFGGRHGAALVLLQ